MAVSSSRRSAVANAFASGKRAKSAGVTMFTRASVHCAERIVATKSCNGFSCSRAQRASGYILARRRTIRRARMRTGSEVFMSGNSSMLVGKLKRKGSPSSLFATDTDDIAGYNASMELDQALDQLAHDAAAPLDV